MIRSAIPLLLSLLASIKSFSQNIRFETKYSEPLAVYQFVASLSEKARDNPYKKLFSSSSFNTKPYTNLVAQFDSLNLENGYEFTAYPIDQKVGGYSESFLKRNLVLSENMQDFKLRSMGLIPNADLTTLTDIL